LLAVEPNRIISAGHQAISARRKLQFTGIVHITLVVDERGVLADDAQITTMGIIDPNDPAELQFEEDIAIEVEDALAELDKGSDVGDDVLAEQARVAVRRMVSQALGLKPKVSVHIVRL
jgi:ribonuclease J